LTWPPLGHRHDNIVWLWPLGYYNIHLQRVHIVETLNQPYTRSLYIYIYCNNMHAVVETAAARSSVSAARADLIRLEIVIGNDVWGLVILCHSSCLHASITSRSHSGRRLSRVYVIRVYILYIFKFILGFIIIIIIAASVSASGPIITVNRRLLHIWVRGMPAPPVRPMYRRRRTTTTHNTILRCIILLL